MAENALEKAGTTAMTRPDWVQQGNTGVDIDRAEIQIPRIGLAQAQSPQLDPKGEVYIDDLRPGDLFNSLLLTKLEKPLDIVVLRIDRARYVQFEDLDKGGGIIDMDIPASDPRTKFTINAETGEREKPIATKFLDYVVAMYPLNPANPMESVIGLSFKGTGLKVAKKLNGLITYRNASLWRAVYRLDAEITKKNNYTFAIFTVANNGWIEKDDDPALERLYKDLAGANVNIDREREDDYDGDADGPDRGAPSM